ncbi:HET-domain-containing protein [Pyrenochaeta sp. DS3sAY3a]|nr:HET-domain-containing protein [Pyrenochaeta sp. DS3sAY3a]
MDYSSSDGSNEDGGPNIYGLEAFDLDYQYDLYASNPVAARIFGLDPPGGNTGPLRPVNLDTIMFNAEIFCGIAMGVVSSIICWVLRWLVVRLLQRRSWRWSWSWNATILVHVSSMLLLDLSGWKGFGVHLFRFLRGGRHVDMSLLKRRMMVVIVYLLTAMALLIVKKFAWVLLRPMGYVPAITALLYKCGLLESFFVVSQERIWVAWMRSKRRWSVAYQEYSKNRGQYEANTLYQYQPALSGQIRLVELKRTHPLARLELRIRTCVLDESPSYEAISYTWGDPNAKHSVTVDSSSISVTRNALDVLHFMAPMYGSRLIWIDSVCIDQRDNVDKNQQVALMAKIYRRASRTIAWLGDTDDAEHAILHLNRLRQALAVGGREAQEDLDLLKQRALGLDDSQHWRALSGLLTHPYWTRVWIVQEIAVSRNIQVLYGTHRIQMTAITEAVERMWDSKINGRIMEEPWKDGAIDVHTAVNHLNIRVTAAIRRLIRQGTYPELREVVRMTPFFDATDPRDKIYAFYNISRVEDGMLEADYRIPLEEAYTRFTAYFIHKHFSELVFMAGHCQPRQHENLPSWVPDFTMRSANTSLIPAPRISPILQDSYSASGDNGDLQPCVSLTSNDHILVRGYYIDRLEHMTATSIAQIWEEIYINDGISPSALHAWHADAIQLALSHTPDKYRSYDESRRQAFVRTLVGDRSSGSGARAPVKYKGYYKHWVSLLATAVDTESLMNDTQEDDELERTMAAKEFNSAVAAAANQKRFSVTAGGYMALIPRESCVGDIVCVLLGIQVPFVLRPVPGAIEKYELVGPCYCHGIMMGEAVANNQAKDFLIK